MNCVRVHDSSSTKKPSATRFVEEDRSRFDSQVIHEAEKYAHTEHIDRDKLHKAEKYTPTQYIQIHYGAQDCRDNTKKIMKGEHALEP